MMALRLQGNMSMIFRLKTQPEGLGYMRNQDSTYEVIGFDGVLLGEVVRRQFYDAQGKPGGATLKESGLVNDESGKLIAGWKEGEQASEVMGYLKLKE